MKNKAGHLRTETYQNNSSCRSNKGVQEPTLQRQPTAAEEKKKKSVYSHQSINIQVNGAHQHTTVFPLIVRGDVPYAATLFPKFHGVIKC